MVPFSNGRCEGANPSSHVIELPDFRFSIQFCRPVVSLFWLGISVPNLETRVPGDRSHPYKKDRWRFHFNFCGLPSRGGKPLWQVLFAAAITPAPPDCGGILSLNPSGRLFLLAYPLDRLYKLTCFLCDLVWFYDDTFVIFHHESVWFWVILWLYRKGYMVIYFINCSFLQGALFVLEAKFCRNFVRFFNVSWIIFCTHTHF